MADDTTVEVQIAADVGDLEAGLARAGKASADAFAAIGASAARSQQALASVGDAYRQAQARQSAAQDASAAQSAGHARALEQIEREHRLAEIAREEDAWQTRRRLGDAGAAEEEAQLQALEERKTRIRRDALDEEMALAAGEPARQDAINAEIERLADQHAMRMQRIQSRSMMEMRQEWQSMLQPVAQAVDQTSQGLVRGTTTARQALARLGESFLADEINLNLRGLTSWIATEAAKTEATTTGAALRQDAEEQAGDASIASLAMKAIKLIYNDAAQAFAGVFAFLAPGMGPYAAIPAAAAGATVAAAATEVASAAGGWVVPGDQLVKVHEREMILPAAISSGLMGMIGGSRAAPAAPSAPSAGHTFNITVNAAHDGRMSGADIARLVAGEIRRFNPALRPA